MHASSRMTVGKFIGCRNAVVFFIETTLVKIKIHAGSYPVFADWHSSSVYMYQQAAVFLFGECRALPPFGRRQ